MSYNYEDLSIGEIKDLLRQWRENNERRSKDVMEFWVTIMDDINKLGNEKYVILEQVLYAALDTHTYSAAEQCIGLLKREFPASLRVMRYRAAQLEAEERYPEALELLDAVVKADETSAAARKRRVAVLRARGLLAEAARELVDYLKKYPEALELLDAVVKADETSAAARKRRVAVLRARGLLAEAARELVDYLKKFMSDVEAWQELCSLYLQAGEYARAAFCAEELLLHQPHSHLLLQRLADIRYTMGGAENMELAKTYYCRAVALNPDNMRALLGLFLASNNLLQQRAAGGARRQELLRLCQHAQSQAAKKHAEARAAAAPPLASMLAALAIAE